ncbi:MAG: hypothetical protein C5B58_07165 [Acidobacteria bacterium]|nr:MAG: hypothetical protein C5B58_07165 [Acidobacteriota bacterium]
MPGRWVGPAVPHCARSITMPIGVKWQGDAVMAKSSLGIALNESGIGSVLNQNRLKVPPNQRSYAWEAPHVQTLLQDLSNAIASESTTYFLGTIVLTRSDDRFEVADGQQRLATTAILISAIRDHLFSGGANEREAAHKYTQNYLLEFDELSGEHQPKLTLNTEDNDFFVKNALLPLDSPERDKAKVRHPSHERIAEAIRLCRKHVSNIIAPYAKADQPKRLYEWIAFLREGAKIIEIKVPDQFNAYTLFETLNDRGLRASQADILKNFLFGKAQDRLNEVVTKWSAMTTIIETVADDELLLTFLRHNWISYNGPTIEKELASAIREQIIGRQQAVDLAISLATNSVDYAGLFSPLEHSGWPTFDKKTRGYLYVISNILQIEQIRPLLLSVIRHFSPGEATKAFAAFVGWSVRFLIAGGGSGGALDRHYGLRAKEVAEGTVTKAVELNDRMKGLLRTDAEFKEAFRAARVSKTILARYYLRALELRANGVHDPDLGGVLEDTTQFNLEHVIPLNPGGAWGLPEEVAQSYAKRLGNMTLLDPAENCDVGNKGLKAKQLVYGQSSLLLTKEIASAASWGPAEIDQRQEKLAELALEIW